MAAEDGLEKGRYQMRMNFYNPNAVEPPEEETYYCPVCEEEIPYGTKLYFNEMGDCVGCEDCLSTRFVEDFYDELGLGIKEALDDL